MEYIVSKAYNKIGISGKVHELSVGTECVTKNNVIMYNDIPLCFTTSQDAYDYFSRNDDGNGLERAELVSEILELISTRDDAYEVRWEALTENDEFSNLCRDDYSNCWLWGSGFYNADVSELEQVKELLETTTEEYIEAKNEEEGTIVDGTTDDDDGNTSDGGDVVADGEAEVSP